MSWAIVVDSSCNLRSFKPTAPDTAFFVAPLKISVADQEYVDDAALDVVALNRRMAAGGVAGSSSCPNAGEWAELFNRADNIIAITISSGLSASFEAASVARTMVAEQSDRNIFVLDSHAAGGKLEVIVELLDRYLREASPSFAQACERVQKLESASQVLFSLSSYENLSRSGRMPKMAGVIASRLSIQILGSATPKGTIKIVGPAHGERKMHKKILSTMESDGYCGGLTYIDYVDSGEGDNGANQLAQEICSRWPSADIRILPCGALCSYYAEHGGLIIGYEWFTTR